MLNLVRKKYYTTQARRASARFRSIYAGAAFCCVAAGALESWQTHRKDAKDEECYASLLRHSASTAAVVLNSVVAPHPGAIAIGVLLSSPATNLMKKTRPSCPFSS